MTKFEMDSLSKLLSMYATELKENGYTDFYGDSENDPERLAHIIKTIETAARFVDWAKE